MTNFVGCLNAFRERDGRFSEDEGYLLPERQFLQAPQNGDERIKKLLKGDYTLFEVVSTCTGFEYKATIDSTIGMSPKQVENEVLTALENEKIPAIVSVKVGEKPDKKGKKNNFLYITITVG